MPAIDAAVGSFPGSVSTIYKWFPDPHEVEAALVSVANYYENLASPLRASARVARLDIKNNFDTESDPTGIPWFPLNSKYSKWKESHGYDDRILRMEGHLEEAATSPDAFHWDDLGVEGELWYSTENLPKYWYVHQVGSPRDNPGFRSFEEIQTGAGKGGNIPQRAFIGLSAEAEAAIFDVFDVWFFAGASNVVVSGSGVLQKRTAGGRFGPRV